MSLCYLCHPCLLFFFFKDPAPTAIYTLSLHDALPIPGGRARRGRHVEGPDRVGELHGRQPHVSGAEHRRGDDRSGRDRKSTRLNSSHITISYAVFCLKKKNIEHYHIILLLPRLEAAQL